MNDKITPLPPEQHDPTLGKFEDGVERVYHESKIVVIGNLAVDTTQIKAVVTHTYHGITGVILTSKLLLNDGTIIPIDSGDADLLREYLQKHK